MKTLSEENKIKSSISIKIYTANSKNELLHGSKELSFNIINGNVKTFISSRKLIKNINLNVTRSGEVVEAIKNIAKKYNNFKWVLIETVYGGYKQRIIKHFNNTFEYFSPNALNDYKRMKK